LMITQYSFDCLTLPETSLKFTTKFLAVFLFSSTAWTKKEVRSTLNIRISILGHKWQKSNGKTGETREVFWNVSVDERLDFPETNVLDTSSNSPGLCTQTFTSMGGTSESAFSFPQSLATNARANSKAVPGPRLVTKLPE
jgi:hypothetical protein